MPSINPNLVPSVAAGNLLDRLSTDPSVNIRWLQPSDPVYFETLNRPHADIALRQLIIAKSLDQLGASIDFMTMFPFLLQPIVEDGTTSASVPIRLFWDFSASIPVKWRSLRLARIDRLDGTNSPYTGTIRFIFVANEDLGGSSSTTDTAIFYVDYEIDSNLTYQIVEINAATTVACPGFTVINTSEVNTVGGTVTFKTGDATSTEIAAFYNLVAPGTSAQYYIANTPAGGSDDYSTNIVVYGTGLITVLAQNAMTQLDSDPYYWLSAFNTPFSATSGRVSIDASVTIPQGMFVDFDIVAPASEEPTGDATGTFKPVWVSRIAKTVNVPQTLVWYFSTYSIEQPGVEVEFATMTLTDTMVAGTVVRIAPLNHLFTSTSTTPTAANWQQQFGRGHATLSDTWGSGGGGFDSFFNSIPFLGGAGAVDFIKTSTAISAFGLSRVPTYTPTFGQSEALKGTSSDTTQLTTPVHPSSTNRYVTAADEGLGKSVDLQALYGVNSAISQYGYMGTRVHKVVKLIIDVSHQEPDFYVNEILPRLTTLLGRAPVFGDVWYNGTRFLTNNGDSWVG